MVAVGSTDKVDALSGFDADLAAYLDAAGGDARLALAWALEDLIRTEQALEAARRLISYGYARGGHSTAQKEP